MKRLFCTALFATVVASAGVASAKNPNVASKAAPAGDTERAKAHFTRGRELSEAKQYAAAYDEFAAGYALTPRPLFLFNMAECQRALKNAAKARGLYEQYLAAEPTGAFAATAKSRIAELTPASPAPATTAPTTAATPPPAPAPAPSPAPAPVLRVAAAEPDPAAEASVTGTRDLGARGDSSPPIYKRPVFWVGVGVAVAGGIAIAYAATRPGDSCTGPCLDLR